MTVGAVEINGEAGVGGLHRMADPRCDPTREWGATSSDVVGSDLGVDQLDDAKHEMLQLGNGVTPNKGDRGRKRRPPRRRVAQRGISSNT